MFGCEQHFELATKSVNGKKISNHKEQDHGMNSQWENHMEQGRQLWSDNKIANAYEAFAKAVSYAKANFSSDDPRLAESLWEQGRVEIYGQGTVISAKEHLGQALAILEKNSSGNEKLLAIVLYDLSETLSRAGEADKAVPLLERALPLYTKIDGAESVSVANTFYSLGINLGAKRNFAKAEKCMDKAAQIFEKKKMNVDLIQALDNLAQMYQFQGKQKEAELVEKKARKIEPTL